MSPTVTTIYYLLERIVASGCTAWDSAVITLAPAAANAGNNETICSGVADTIGASKVTGSTYSWASSPPGFTSTISNPIVSPKKTTSYTVTETNTYGCVNSNSVTITISKPTAAFSFTQSCPGDSTYFSNLSTNATKFGWFIPNTSETHVKNPVHLFAGTGTYVVELYAIDSFGCEDSIIKSITISPCVWPGDANFDKTDNIYDVLAVGLAYNDTGSKRPDTTTQWYAHPSINWPKSFKSGANHKHADCNGDGKVDSLDLAAIVRNYSQTHSKSGGASGGNPSDPALYLTTSMDSVGTQDTLLIQMNLGTSAKQVSNIYGLCFSVKYDPMNVNQSKGIMADFSKCWLGTLNKNLVYVIHNDSSNGILDIGITRTDHKNVSGYGPIGVLSIITPDNVGGKREVRKELHFDIENEKAIDNIENDVSLYTSGDSTLFYGYTGIEPLSKNISHVRLYPNPANSVLHLDAGNEFISEITVSNILGQRVLSQKCTRLQHTDLNIESLVPGTYIINVQTDNGMARARFVKD